MSNLLQEILASPSISRMRRNHALEHATIHVLSARYPQAFLIGRSDPRGFFLFGDVPTTDIYRAAHEALARLQNGERRLAIHPNCGTNFATAGTMAGLATFFSLLGMKSERWRDRLARLPFVIFAATLALIIAQPLGFKIQQRLTTQGNPGELQILGIRDLSRARAHIHRVLTQG